MRQLRDGEERKPTATNALRRQGTYFTLDLSLRDKETRSCKHGYDDKATPVDGAYRPNASD